MSKSTRELLGFDDRWLMLLGIPIIATLINLMMFGSLLSLDMKQETLIGFLQCNFVSLIYTIIFWVAYRQLVLFLRKRHTLDKNIHLRMVIQVALVIGTYIIIKTIMKLTIDDYLNGLTSGLADHNPISMIVGSLLCAFLILAIYESVYYYSKLQASKFEQQQLEKENIHSQLEGLRSQVNPHFLFNSLNTLTYIIPDHPDRAVRFVQQLSKVYRYILEMKDKKLISLEEELKFLDAYVFLLKERFESNLDVIIDIPKDQYKNHIVPLSLQMLVENAIKHNIVSANRPLTVEVFIEKNNTLVVRNNLQRKQQEVNSTKVGLQNIQNRYAFLSDRTVEIITSAKYFTVALPLIDIPEKSAIPA